jgi:hypothetical protein
MLNVFVKFNIFVMLPVCQTPTPERVPTPGPATG